MILAVNNLESRHHASVVRACSQVLHSIHLAGYIGYRRVSHSGLLCSSPVGILVTKHNGDRVQFKLYFNS